MTDCKFGCGKKRNYLQLRNDIHAAMASGRCANVPFEMLLAVGIRESFGNMFFARNEGQYFDNLKVYMLHSRFSTYDALQTVRVLGGIHQGKTAKFRYEPRWTPAINTYVKQHPDALRWREILHLSIGYFQKGMIWHLPAKPFVEWQTAYETFLKDSTEQTRVCSFDLHGLIHRASGDVPLALSRYNGGPGVRHATDYGKQVYDLYRYLLTE